MATLDVIVVFDYRVILRIASKICNGVWWFLKDLDLSECIEHTKIEESVWARSIGHRKQHIRRNYTAAGVLEICPYSRRFSSDVIWLCGYLGIRFRCNYCDAAVTFENRHYRQPRLPPIGLRWPLISLL